jgi:hypothetical protein
VRRNPAPNASSRNLTGSSSRGSTTMSVRHGLPKNSRELGTLKTKRAPCRIQSVVGLLTPEGFRFREFLEIREKQVVQVVKGLPRANAARALWLGLPFLWIGIAHAQVTYTPLQAPGIVVTGIRSNSSTTDDVVVTGSLATGGTTTAALYSGSLQALPTTATSGWNFPTPNFGASQTVTSSTFYGPNTPLFDTSLPAGVCALSAATNTPKAPIRTSIMA